MIGRRTTLAIRVLAIAALASCYMSIEMLREAGIPYQHHAGRGLHKESSPVLLNDELAYATSATDTVEQVMGEELPTLKDKEDGTKPTREDRPNLLFIMTDQQRFDALRHVQDEMPIYNDKFKIRTPNMDRIALNGVYFRNTYCSSPICGPSRVSLRTGNTVQRTGCQSNALVEKETYSLSSHFAQKVNTLESYDQLLVEEQGYVAEHYGKWHMPLRLYFERSGEKPVITYNDYVFKTNSSRLTIKGQFKHLYKPQMNYLIRKNKMRDLRTVREGQQLNPKTRFPYDPIRLDPGYGINTTVPFVNEAELKGRDSLPSNFSTTSVIGAMSVRSLERLSKRNDPFSLTVSFTNPHPPYIAAPEYFDFYEKRRSQILVPPSLEDPMLDSEYLKDNQRNVTRGYKTSDPIAEWTATYYAMVEEIDFWVGKLLDKLEEVGLSNNTLVVFTSDHGEMLGAHNMHGKGNLLEESTRVPLLMSFPGRIESKHTVDAVVSHIDVLATIMDYLGSSYIDKSDGMSLRRFIENTSFNKDYDEQAVVSELDKRSPVSETELEGTLGRNPNFMIRKGDYKLIITKKADGKSVDMMYDLSSDPYEMTNLLGKNGANASHMAIGKAEHLKILLIEWMKRNDGPLNYYSDNKYNGFEGRGDITEIHKRRTWKTLDYWQSSKKLSFGKPIWNDGKFVRNEYLYIGRTNPGYLNVSDISVQGSDASYFRVNHHKATISEGEYLQIKVSFQSSEMVDIGSLHARIEIKHNVNEVKKVKIV